MSPANTPPLFTPIRTGILRCLSAIFRSASSIRSSSLPVIVGAPAVRISLPPSSSASVDRKHTPYSSQAACVSASSSCRPSATASGAALGIMSSVPSKWMNAIEICRCSGVPPPASTWLAHGRRQAVRHGIRIDVVGRDLARPRGARAARASARIPGPLASPMQRGGSCLRDLAGSRGCRRRRPTCSILDRSASSRARSRPARDATRRRGRSDRCRCARRPTCGAARGSPAPRSGPTSRRALRIHTADRQAFATWSPSSNSSRSASPPNLIRLPSFA